MRESYLKLRNRCATGQDSVQVRLSARREHHTVSVLEPIQKREDHRVGPIVHRRGSWSLLALEARLFDPCAVLHSLRLAHVTMRKPAWPLSKFRTRLPGAESFHGRFLRVPR